MRGIWLAVAVVGLLVGGCAKPNPYQRYPVTVTVTLDDKPLPDGHVDFYAVDGRGTYGADVKDGVARFESVAGAMTVQIGVFRLPAGKTKVPGAVLDDRVNILPERYHAKTELKTEVK